MMGDQGGGNGAGLPRVIAVAGATATGKSALAMQLARMLGGEIVSCDSVQIYRGADIGSAKVGAAERAEIRHHCIDLCAAGEAFSAADWVREADEAIRGIVERGRVPIVVGGSGLYLRSLWFGLSASPAADAAVREGIEAEAEVRGWPALHAELAAVDPVAAARIHPNDRVRISRGLEVWRVTGEPLSAQQARHGLREARLAVAGIGVTAASELLRVRIAARVEEMMEAGLVEEVRALLGQVEDAGAPPLDAIGYREVVEALSRGEGPVDVDGLRHEIARNTRRYARRQHTWFRRQVPLRWGRVPMAHPELDVLVDALRGFLRGEAWRWGCASPQEALVCRALSMEEAGGDPGRRE